MSLRHQKLSASGDFELVEFLDGDEGDVWVEIRNVDNGEHVFITGVLLMTATFADAHTGGG